MMAHYLLQRPSSFYFRYIIPERFYASMGIRELRYSLKPIAIKRAQRALTAVRMALNTAPMNADAKALLDHPRNVPDAAIETAREISNIWLNYDAKHGAVRAFSDDVADHVEYIHDTAGINHAGIASDYYGMPDMPAGLDKPK